MQLIINKEVKFLQNNYLNEWRMRVSECEWKLGK